MSLAYMAWDFGVVVALGACYSWFASFGLPGLVVYWNLQGFFLWALFVVGHDCGHGSFSRLGWINDVCGHICHAPLMVPYWPWQLSHRLHHTNHNHLTNDTSHPWLTEAQEAEMNLLHLFLLHSPWAALFKYTVIYLALGRRDGSHFSPWSKLFPTLELQVKCGVSTAVCVAFAAWLYGRVGGDLAILASMYFAPLAVFNFWITMVTYLQHHSEGTEVLEDGAWTFVRGALETVDRPYGRPIDVLAHHITDGHVVHHFFPTAIPHYHLEKATAAVASYLGERGLYKKIDTTWTFVAQFARLSDRLRGLERTPGAVGVFRYKAPAEPAAAGLGVARR